jgi:hypothetical protein
VLALLVNRVGVGRNSVMMYDVVFVAARYLVAKVRKHMQMVRMLFAGSVGMLRVKSPVAVIVDAVNLIASAVALLLLFSRFVRFGFTMRLGDVRAIPLPAAHLAESVKSISCHYTASLSVDSGKDSTFTPSAGVGSFGATGS